MPTKMINLDNWKMGHFCLWENTGGLTGNVIENAQLKQGHPKAHARYVHIDVLGGGPYAVRVNPPVSKVVDIRKHYKNRGYIIVKYRHLNFDKKRHKIAFWAATHCNLKYDWLGVMKFKLKGLMWHKENLYFCSENALWSLQKEFPGALNILPYECMPARFLDNEFEVVDQGRIE